MKRTTLSLFFVLMFIATGVAQETDRRAALESIVAAERAFAKAAAEHGVRAAFLMNLADDATLFRPHAVNGKQWTEGRPDRPGLLTWFPTYADVSRDGDLGYTTGPYEFRQSAGDKAINYGYFMTVWKRQADGQWKAVLDQGVSTPPPTGAPADLQFAAPAAPAGKTAASVPPDSLLGLDREFAAAAASKGAAAAYATYAADDLRLYRDGRFPLVGKPAARPIFSAGGALAWQPAKADVSRSGDLGYTYGLAQWKASQEAKAEYANYVRLWKRQADGQWRVVLEVFAPCPPPAHSGQ
jgi:ketosteroid isomerase-like protein